MNDIRLEGNVYIFTLRDTKTHITRTFTLEGKYTAAIKHYISLRPAACTTEKFFLHYANGKCYNQVIGINKIGSMPSIIAKWLNLPNPSEYTGHSFRRTSTTILSNAGASMVDIKRHGGWKSDNVAQKYIEDSINNKRKISNLISNSIIEEKTIKKSCKDEIINIETSKDDDDFGPSSSTCIIESKSSDDDDDVTVLHENTNKARAARTSGKCSTITLNIRVK